MPSEFDPEIMKRSLPPDIHGVISQVTQNVNLAVARIVGEFKDQAAAAVKRFENQDFSADLDFEIKKTTADLQADLKQFDGALASLRANAAKAAAIAAAADSPALRQAVEDLNRQAEALQAQLKAFKDKTDTFGRKVGGAIASAAVKTFTGGIG
jgi:cell division septum initiation protein DivIVA